MIGGVTGLRPALERLRTWWRPVKCLPPSYWLTRFVVLRLLGLVYFFAFFSLARQVLPLVGSRGLLPADLFMQRLETAIGSRLGGFLQFPSLFWIDASDASLQAMAWLGTGLALL